MDYLNMLAENDTCLYLMIPLENHKQVGIMLTTFLS